MLFAWCYILSEVCWTAHCRTVNAVFCRSVHIVKDQICIACQRRSVGPLSIPSLYPITMEHYVHNMTLLRHLDPLLFVSLGRYYSSKCCKICTDICTDTNNTATGLTLTKKSLDLNHDENQWFKSPLFKSTNPACQKRRRRLAVVVIYQWSSLAYVALRASAVCTLQSSALADTPRLCPDSANLCQAI